MRKLFFAVLLAGVALLPSVPQDAQEPAPAKAKLPKHLGPTPVQLAKNIVSSPFDPEHRKFPRGLKRTPFRKILNAKRFDRASFKAAPAQTLMLPTQLSMWGNSQYGDCVSASEAARIAAYSVFCNLPEIFIPEANVISWAQQYGYLNGADLTDVMSTMQQHGMTASNGNVYTDGPYAAVEYADEPTLQAALATGPVNFGIDADALPSGAGNASGWYAFGGNPGQFSNEDHCTPSFGYVTGPTSVATAFAAVNKAYGVNVSPPANAPTGNVYLWYTWSTVGIVDHPWIMSTAGEAWICNPTTVGVTPQPAPIPTPTPPTPTPTPTPTPGTPWTLTLPTAIPAGSYELATPGTAAWLASAPAPLGKLVPTTGPFPPAPSKAPPSTKATDSTDPAMQMRLDMAEKRMDSVESRLEKQGQDLKQIIKMLSAPTK